MNRNLDKTKLSYGDVIDPRLGQIWNTTTTPANNTRGLDFSSGLLISYKNFYFGAAVFHINRPNLSFLGSYPWPTRISIHSSYNFHLTEKSLLQALVRYDNQQNLQYISANLNALFNKHFIVGAGYRGNTGDNSLEVNRWNADINLNIGWRTNFFTLCIGYDKRIYKYPYSPGPGSWEVMMSINFRNRANRRTITNFESW